MSSLGAAGYSFFGGDSPVDLSWILKLSDEDKHEPSSQESKVSISVSSSPDRNSEGYGSTGDDQGSKSNSPMPPPFQPTNLNLNALSAITLDWEGSSTSSSATVLSQHVGQRSQTMPLWSHPGVVGVRSLQQLIPAGFPYSLQAPPYTLLTCEEVFFYLVPGKAPFGSTAQVINTPMKAYVKVTHSSGFVSNVEMQKLELIPGFRCSFFPYYSGKYSVRAFQCIESTTHPNYASYPGGLICPPLELEVSRNYSMEARNPTTPVLSMDDNNEKYWGIAVDKFSDRLYITDRHNNDVMIVDTVIGSAIHRFGQDPSLSFAGSNLFRPTGLVMDDINKRLLICDKDNHRIAIYSIDGVFISTFGKKGHGPGEFNYPWDVDISPSGDMIAVSDSRNHRVQIFDRFGNYLSKFTVFETDPFEYKRYFDYPRGITFGKNGKTIFISDFNTNNVVSLDLPSLEYRLLVPNGKMCRPQGLTVDDVGNLIVCDSRKNSVRVMSHEGNLLTTISKVGRHQVYVPVDACVLQGGQIATLGINGRIYFF